MCFVIAMHILTLRSAPLAPRHWLDMSMIPSRRVWLCGVRRGGESRVAPNESHFRHCRRGEAVVLLTRPATIPSITTCRNPETSSRKVESSSQASHSRPVTALHLAILLLHPALVPSVQSTQHARLLHAPGPPLFHTPLPLPQHRPLSCPIPPARPARAGWSLWLAGGRGVQEAPTGVVG